MTHSEATGSPADCPAGPPTLLEALRAARDAPAVQDGDQNDQAPFKVGAATWPLAAAAPSPPLDCREIGCMWRACNSSPCYSGVRNPGSLRPPFDAEQAAAGELLRGGQAFSAAAGGGCVPWFRCAVGV